MAKKNKILIVGIIVIVLLVAVGFLYFNGNFSTEGFKVNTILLKLSMITGGELSTDVKITNNENTEQIFDLYFLGLEETASVDESQFSLGRGEEKTIKVSFNDINDEVAVHIGYLVIETSKLTKKIPIVLTVEDINPFFAITQKQIQNYVNVYPGGKIGMDIKIFDLKSEESQNINANYLIENFNDEILISEDENLVVEKTASVSKIIDIPDNMEHGDYVFITSINYNGKSISAYYFEITNKDSSGGGFGLGNLEYFALIVLVFVIGMFWLIFRFFSARDKLIIQLQKQQNFEMSHNVKAIKEYRQELEKIKDISEKKIKLKQLSVKKKRVVDTIKKKHERQKEERRREQEKGRKDFIKIEEKYEKEKEKVIRLKEKEKRKNAVKKLKEEYEKEKKEVIESKENAMKKKLNDWKNEGYAMTELRTHIKEFPKEKITARVAEWKKQGYVLK